LWTATERRGTIAAIFWTFLEPDPITTSRRKVGDEQAGDKPDGVVTMRRSMPAPVQ
jgi:hypothetical protein